MRWWLFPCCLLVGCYISLDDTFPDSNPGPYSESCFNGRFDSGEGDIDCGGRCPPCEDGKICDSNNDCASGLCELSLCVPAACDNDTEDPEESDVDCGGPCNGCAVGENCNQPKDCASGFCNDGTICVETSCEDDTASGDESDVNCGGSCAPCAVSLKCNLPEDCASGFCNAGTVCVATSCEDDVQSGEETDLNCGGPDCLGCTVGEGCGENTDCLNTYCNGTVCVATSCEDLIRDGDETDVNCGGSCPACGGGKNCAEDGDCLAGDCLPNGTCKCPVCPEEMSQIPGGCDCVDNYETSVFNGAACDGSDTSYGDGSDDYPAGFPHLVTSDGMTGTVQIGSNTFNLVEPTVDLYACSIAGEMPSVHLTYFQAKRLCENSGKRLCTLAEWLSACHGPADTAYPYGTDWVDGYCNDSVPSSGTNDACGSHTACHGEGITETVYDMSGNVLEWLEDCVGNMCQIRGGFWYDNEFNVRCEDPRNSTPGTIDDYYGARCCLTQ